MAKIKKIKAGRPPVPEEDKVKRIPISAKLKHHKAIKLEFAEKVERFEKKLDKEAKQ